VTNFEAAGGASVPPAVLPMRTVSPFLLLLMLPAILAGASAGNVDMPASGESAVAHDFHVSYSRLAIQDKFAVCNIRFFRDDLDKGLRGFSEQEDFVLSVSPRTDSLLLSYLSTRFVIKVGGDSLSGAIIGSGEDFEGKEAIWWYTIQYQAEEPIASFNLVNKILIEYFDDQKNIVKIQRFPSEKTASYYFDTEDTTFDIAL